MLVSVTTHAGPRVERTQTDPGGMEEMECVNERMEDHSFPLKIRSVAVDLPLTLLDHFLLISEPKATKLTPDSLFDLRFLI